MATTDVVKQKVQEAAATSGGNGQPTVFDVIKRQRDAIEMALPKHFDTDRFTRIALTTVRTTPKLAECNAASLLGALMVSAQLGVEPGGPLGQAYLVPYGREVQFILGYKGIIELARRSGQLSSIEAHEVCENDDFAYSYGLADSLTHVPLLRGDRGNPYAYYAIAKFKDGGHAFVVLSRDDVDRHRARSKSKGGPWSTDYDAMARKTCIRVLAPYLPLSPELERAIAADERTYRTATPDLSELPEFPALEAGSEAETGEGEPSGDAGSPEPDEADPERPFE